MQKHPETQKSKNTFVIFTREIFYADVIRWHAVRNVKTGGKKVLVDGAYTGECFEKLVWQIPGARVEMVERSFPWMEKCRRLWKNCERKMETSLQFVALAFLALLLRRH